MAYPLIKREYGMGEDYFKDIIFNTQTHITRLIVLYVDFLLLFIILFWNDRCDFYTWILFCRVVLELVS